jgi:hypothetical protein
MLNPETRKPELRRVKVYRGMSEETTAFTAELWMDGQHIAYLKNAGRGGNNDIQHLTNNKGLNTRHEVATFVKWCDDYDLSPCCRAYTTYSDGVLCCKICYEAVSHGGIGADYFITLMLQDYEEEQRVKRWCKKKTVIRLEGDKPGAYHTYKRAYDPEFAQRIRDTEPTLLEIVNERYLEEGAK